MEPDVDDEHVFNIESCAETAELEALFRCDAIGSTLYDRRWVIKTAMELAEKREEGLTEDLEQKFGSLVEMTAVEKDVCSFLHESGCLDVFGMLLQSQSDDDRSAELALCVLANVVGSSKDILEGLVHVNPGLIQVPFQTLVSVDSVPVLCATFKFLKAFVIALSGLIDDSSDPSSSDLVPVFQSYLSLLFQDPGIVRRTSHLLSASTNNDLLDDMSKYLLALIELGLEHFEEDFLESDYFHTNFLLGLSEALTQILSDPNCAFRLLEALGQLCQPENVADPETSVRVLGVVSDFVKEYCTGPTADHSSLGMAAKICYDCWQTRAHTESWRVLRRALLAVKTMSGQVDDLDVQAVEMNLEKCLREYELKYAPSPPNDLETTNREN